jgi:hypothetical protein
LLVGIVLQEVPMAIVLDHTIVPDKEASAHFLARNVFDDIKINHRRGGRGFYFRVGHVLEVLTA